MAYETAKTDWNEAYEPAPEDMNRIEGNTQANYNDIIANDGEIATLNGLVIPNIDQNVKTTGSPTFNGVTTDNVIIKHKLFTGTTNASGNADIATPGITPSKILNIAGYVNDGTTWTNILEVSGSDRRIQNSINIATSQVFCFGDVSLASRPYRVLITYEG